MGRKPFHGHCVNGKETKTYQTWSDMQSRCNNLNHRKYKWYGGRGITVCDCWSEFKNFLKDMGERPENLTLDRKNNDGNYKKDNCRWVTQKQQIRNSRVVKLTPLKVQVIKKLLKESNLKPREIGEIFSVHSETIRSIKRENTWIDIIP